MNRAERRLQKKQEEKPISRKRLANWVKSLNKEQQKLIDQYVQIENEVSFNRLTHSLDLNFTAAMILKTDLSIDGINNIFGDVFDLMKEDREKDEELKRKFKNEGEFIAFMKNVEKELRIRIEELISEGLKDKEIREKLFLEFPSLSKAKITNCVKKMREIENEAKAMKEAVDKIMAITDPKPTKVVTGKELLKEKKNEEVKEMKKEVKKEVKPVVKEDKPVTAPKKENALKISKMEVKGAYATYTVETKRVAVKVDKKFNKDTWEKFKAEVDAVFNML